MKLTQFRATSQSDKSLSYVPPPLLATLSATVQFRKTPPTTPPPFPFTRLNATTQFDAVASGPSHQMPPPSTSPDCVPAASAVPFVTVNPTSAAPSTK